MNYWDELMGDDDGAATYMLSYGEGPGSPLRHFIGGLINDGETVLDVGCGPGWNLDHFFQFGPAIAAYKGLDYSERFVRVARARHADKKTEEPDSENEFYAVGDVRHPNEPDDSWDVVLYQDVLEHTNGYEGPVKEALRVAKKRVIVTFWHLTENDDHININPAENDKDGWGAWYSQPKWEKFLDSLGVSWLHDEIPRKGAKHDIYIITKEAV